MINGKALRPALAEKSEINLDILLPSGLLGGLAPSACLSLLFPDLKLASQRATSCTSILSRLAVSFLPGTCTDSHDRKRRQVKVPREAAANSFRTTLAQKSSASVACRVSNTMRDGRLNVLLACLRVQVPVVWYPMCDTTAL